MVVERIKKQHSGFQALEERSGSHILAHQNWVSADQVKTSFDIYHDGTGIILQYFVKEDYVRAVNTAFNSSVWEDSCVEFFLSFTGAHSYYYNFEFNAIGTVLGAYGKNRIERKWMPVALLEKVEVFPSLGKAPFKEIAKPTSWNLQVRIPVDALPFSNITDLSGATGSANFYKCGDLLKHPHYLSWKPVKVPGPDFHLPRFFGPVSFR